MLQHWDIDRWNQHSLIKDLTKYQQNLRTRIFGGERAGIAGQRGTLPTKKSDSSDLGQGLSDP